MVGGSLERGKLGSNGSVNVLEHLTHSNLEIEILFECVCLPLHIQVVA